MRKNLLTKVQTFTKQLRRDDRGASMVEYGLLVALIAVVVAGGAAVLGGAIDTLFRGITL